MTRFRAPVLRLAIAVAAAWAPPRAQAWGFLGHRAVARIAEDILARNNPRALAAARAIIGGGAAAAEPAHLDDVAACADMILFMHAPVRCGAFTLPPDNARATAPWHYINIPAMQPMPRAPADLLNDAYCPGGNCVVAQIDRWARFLQDGLWSPNVSPEDKLRALMFVVHFVGDLHQPLHAAEDGDRGGNQKWVTLDDSCYEPAAQGADPAAWPERDASQKRLKLHALWDGLVLTKPQINDGTSHFDLFVRGLEQEMATQNISLYGWDRGDWRIGALLSVQEDWNEAHEFIYPWYALDPAHMIGRDYLETLQPEARYQAEKAGDRLAVLLGRVLGVPPPAGRTGP